MSHDRVRVGEQHPQALVAWLGHRAPSLPWSPNDRAGGLPRAALASFARVRTKLAVATVRPTRMMIRIKVSLGGGLGTDTRGTTRRDAGGAVGSSRGMAGMAAGRETGRACRRASVRAPTAPSGASPWRVWNAVTACRVMGPKRPSSGPAWYPSARSRRWTARTRCDPWGMAYPLRYRTTAVARRRSADVDGPISPST